MRVLTMLVLTAAVLAAQVDPVALDRIATEGARIFRTDRNGAITALTDGTSLEVHSFLTPSSTENSAPPLSAAHTGNDR